MANIVGTMRWVNRSVIPKERLFNGTVFPLISTIAKRPKITFARPGRN